ncbi:MAG: hypothetical protein J6T15_01215 [Bacilli bacterium]|nr:hypothetical protein [Bacilli bacterium]
MNKILDSLKNFFKNKSIGYFISAAGCLLAFIFAIIYMATYESAIGNNASGFVPESVGIFLFAGVVVNIVLLVLPQYGFINWIVILFYGLALYKQIFLVPDFFAGLATGIEYNGGDAGLNIFYLIALLIIVIIAVVTTFLGYYKKAEEKDADFKNVKGVVPLAKIGGGAGLILIASLVSCLVVYNLSNVVIPVYAFNPITEEIKALAAEKDTGFDPASKIYAKQETYDFTTAEFTAISNGASTREGHNLVYLFEGAYSEGYQGQYNEYYCNLWLWDDGYFTGKSHNQTFKGYWFNDFDGDGQADNLKMVSNSEKYASIECTKSQGYYNYQAYIYMHPGWGDGRSMPIAGYLYYDAIALAIDTKDFPVYKVGQSFTTSNWEVNRILQNLNYGSIFNMPDGDDPKMKIKWTLPEDLLDKEKKLAKAGEFEIKAEWGGLETSVTITVK